MPFINLEGLDGDYEDKPVPEGTYTLRIEAAEDGRNKADTADMTTVRLKVEDADHPDAATIWHYIVYPNGDDKPEAHRRKMRLLQSFLKAFGVPFDPSGFDTEDLIGAVGECALKQEEYEGRVSNKLSL